MSLLQVDFVSAGSVPTTNVSHWDTMLSSPTHVLLMLKTGVDLVELTEPFLRSDCARARGKEITSNDPTLAWVVGNNGLKTPRSKRGRTSTFSLDNSRMALKNLRRQR